MIFIQFLAVFLLVNVLPGLAFVFYFTRKKENTGILDKLILSVIVSPLVLVLVSFLEEAFGLPQSRLILGINIAVLTAANIALLVRYFPQRANYLPRLNWVKLAVYALFAALVFFRVWPTHGLPAPILHDPIAQTEWLKLLNTTHFTTTEQWYPQGLVLYLNYYATFLPVFYPAVVLISASAILAFFPISLFYLGLLTFRGNDKWMLFPLIIFVIAARLAYPNELYYIAGKNSMILAFAMAPLLMYLIATLKNRWDYIISASLVFAVIVIHYPTGFFLLFMMFFINLGEVFKVGGRKLLAIDRRALSYYGSAVAVTAGLGASLLYKILPIYQSHPVSEDGSFSLTIQTVQQSGVIDFIYRNFLADQLQAYHTTPVILFAASLSAFLVVRDSNKWFTSRLLISSSALYALGVLLLLAGGISLGVNYNVEIRFFLVFLLVLLLAWFAHYALGRTVLKLRHEAVVKGALVVLLALIFLNFGFGQYRMFKDTGAARETVTQGDLGAFDFINRNVGDDKEMLIQLGSPLPNNGIIVGADSGVWIPTFTDKKVEVDFLQFTGARSSRIFDLYMNLAKDGQDVSAIRELYCDYDIGYVFFGSKTVYFDNMKPGVLEQSGNFEKIYDSGARIYRLKPVSCPA